VPSSRSPITFRILRSISDRLARSAATSSGVLLAIRTIAARICATADATNAGWFRRTSVTTPTTAASALAYGTRTATGQVPALCRGQPIHLRFFDPPMCSGAFSCPWARQ
jgi:hypothetical protein